MNKKDITELSPFTGKQDVIIESDDLFGISKICMGSGYTTNELLSNNENERIQYESQSPELIRETKYYDSSTGLYWYLTVLNTPWGMVYPEGDVSSYEWLFAPIIPLTENEKLNYPIPGKDGEYYQSRVAVEHAERYSKDDFRTAVNTLNMFIEAVESKKK